MPNYTYRCPNGHEHTELVSFKHRKESRHCPFCATMAEWQFPVEAVSGIQFFESGYCEALDCDVSGYHDMVEKARRIGFQVAGDKVRGGRDEETRMEGLQPSKGKSFDEVLRRRDRTAELKENWNAYAQTPDGEVKVKESSNLKKGITVRHLTAPKR